ncbi:S8 family serine peptidase [Streptomyces sp. ITFR-6]|uniref:S8 family serine peptidase n=1 Tax=Streptomyces sp. ITFR-6 TaxID=3075197 RepID=UPI00288952F7|nr:S8 family serine peptidase [Streptomyces sp. ITFR-6]WNI27639.1 S8 family serine peptidase [Streptomyces sp. ITFR-6]
MHLSRSPRRRTAAWAAAALTVTGLLIGPPSAAAASGPTAQVDAALLNAVDGGGDASFFVVLKDKADLSPAKSKRAHAAKAKSAFSELKTKAQTSQRSLNSFLDKKKVGHQDFWIANTVKVTGDADLIAELSKRSDVARIVKEQHYKLDDIESKPSKAQTKAAVNAASKAAATEEDGAPEWGVKDIKADQVWDEYEDRGEGIVIADLDSGVQYDHPDLVGNCRGNNGDGSFTHDYNWFDASGQYPTSAPCDNNGHGTHTMGTMVGKDGVGVAPGATWIAAKGCETDECSDSSLLAAGQWILAPTDHNGANPRPDLAPNKVNNSWGGGRTTFYQDALEAWNAAGIFEAFAVGNKGDGATCSTTEAPGAQAPAYGVGAYDSTGKIAKFSGFGPSLVDGSMKPNISAPGVDVRSTWPGDSYNTISGTSMATPHVVGAVALLWSAAPSLIGDIDATRTLLNEGATDGASTDHGTSLQDSSGKSAPKPRASGSGAASGTDATDTPVIFTKKSALDGVTGLGATVQAGSQGYFTVHSLATVQLHKADGSTAWTRNSDSLYADWGITHLRPWEKGFYPARVLMSYDAVSPFSPYSDQGYDTGDLTGDGVPDLVFSASVGIDPPTGVVIPGTTMTSGTVVTVLDGKTGNTLWSKVHAYAGAVKIVDGTLLVADSPQLNSGPPDGATGALYGTRFSYADGALTPSSTWTYDTGETGVAAWGALEDAGDGKVTASWNLSKTATTAARGSALVLDTADGSLVWKTDGELYGRQLHLDAARGRMVALEQADTSDAVRYQIASYDLASGKRITLDTRINALPTAMTVGDVTSGSGAEYAVSESTLDSDMFLNASTVRVVSGSDGATVQWTHTTKRAPGNTRNAPATWHMDVVGGKLIAAAQDDTDSTLARTSAAFGTAR